jgi:SAM-dependent methyltransferase
MVEHQDPGWTGERVANWLRQETAIERQLAPVSEILFAAADLRPGERVLDVGCGAGPTTREAARRVGPEGRVAGLDVSGDMLAAAARHDGEDGAAPIDWIEADAVTWDPPGGAYDVVLSRFGVMFFSDPAAAFATLGRAARDGGRLAVAVWGFRDESDVFRVALEAALAVLPSGTEVPPPDEGPFSLGDPGAVRSLLAGAGWSGVDVAVHDLALRFAGGGLGVEESADVALCFGPTRLVAAGLDDEARAQVKTAIAAAFEPHVRDGSVVLQGRVHVVTATR